MITTPKVPFLTYTTLTKLQSQSDVQIINHRVSIKRLTDNESCMYYNQIRYDISRKIQPGKQVFVNFITNSNLKDQSIFNILLSLQRELTPNVIIPKSFYNTAIDEWIEWLQPEIIVVIKNN
jgi:hypothetical protein